MKYLISHLARQDLENIWLYTFENWSADQADRCFNLIMDEIEYISSKPDSGYDYSQVRKGSLRSRIKSHFLFYRINKKKNLVEIIRILHQRMDIESRLTE
ncbi:MAG: type II toxin-antitoxin system RelE/ParE family toxin [Bacteroidales bacterium]|nr:type II toxin-antitoxin system RelE/ParE family toxin [Bacteroidales bacterium]